VVINARINVSSLVYHVINSVNLNVFTQNANRTAKINVSHVCSNAQTNVNIHNAIKNVMKCVTEYHASNHVMLDYLVVINAADSVEKNAPNSVKTLNAKGMILQK